jgi:hypothetical protein
MQVESLRGRKDDSRSMSDVADALSDKFSAAASAAGYLFQVRFALLRALEVEATHPDAIISIELLDDVAFEASGVPLELIQTKHHVSKQASLSDASPDLWKTIRIWAEKLAQNADQIAESRLVLVTTADAAASTVASKLRAHSGRSVEDAVATLTNTAMTSENVALQSSFSAFLNLSPAMRLALVSAITVVDGVADVADLESRLSAALHFAAKAEQLPELIERLEGWWWGRACLALKDPTKARVPVAEIRARLDSIQEDLRAAKLPVSYASAEPDADESAALEGRPFIRQLKRVGVAEMRRDIAKREFYRAYQQRSDWANKFLVADEETTDFERRLIEEWQPRFGAMCEELGDAPGKTAITTQGRKLYQWVELDAFVEFRGVSQRFLTRGSYHMLADNHRVGWASNYKDDDSGGAE